jgi:hypothetical protein
MMEREAKPKLTAAASIFKANFNNGAGIRKRRKEIPNILRMLAK